MQIDHDLPYFRKAFSLMVFVTLKIQMFISFPIMKKKSIYGVRLKVIFLLAKSYTEFLMLSFIFKPNIYIRINFIFKQVIFYDIKKLLMIFIIRKIFFC